VGISPPASFAIAGLIGGLKRNAARPTLGEKHRPVVGLTKAASSLRTCGRRALAAMQAGRPTKA